MIKIFRYLDHLVQARHGSLSRPPPPQLGAFACNGRSLTFS